MNEKKICRKERIKEVVFKGRDLRKLADEGITVGEFKKRYRMNKS